MTDGTAADGARADRAESGGETDVGGAGDAHAADRDDTGEVPAWQLVPAAPAGTVPVRWTDLRAMRRRIDRLERETEELRAERERLRGELDRTHEDLLRERARRKRTVDRYERLLGERGVWSGSTAESDADRGVGAEATGADGGDERPAVATDGGTETDTGGAERGRDGVLGRVLSVVGRLAAVAGVSRRRG